MTRPRVQLNEQNYWSSRGRPSAPELSPMKGGKQRRSEPVIVAVKLHHPDAKVPRLANKGDVAFDLYSVEDVTLKPGEWHAVATGISLEIAPGYEGQVRPRSGLALKHGVTVLNAPGTIDSGYRGEVKSIMINHGKEPFKITEGMRISQLAIRVVPKALFEAVETLEDSDRGEGGFGSTGMK